MVKLVFQRRSRLATILNVPPGKRLSWHSGVGGWEAVDVLKDVTRAGALSWEYDLGLLLSKATPLVPSHLGPCWKPF